MPQSPFTERDLTDTENYLKTYAVCFRMLQCERIDARRASDDRSPSVGPIFKAKMYHVRQFVMALPNTDEKLFLYYHYIRGDSISRCASLLGLSRSSTYRLRLRALAFATECLRKDARDAEDAPYFSFAKEK